MAELVEGKLEILPVPTWLHQLIVDFLVTEVKRYLQNHEMRGVVLFAPLPVKLFKGTSGRYLRAFPLNPRACVPKAFAAH